MKSNRSVRLAASIQFFRVLAVCIPVLMLVDAAAAQEPPGYSGTHTIVGSKTPANTYWYDAADGISPGLPGCHVEVVSLSDWRRTGRFIEEACRSDGLLIETTPGINAIHVHEKDIGKPYLINCNAWCIGARRSKAGRCQTVRRSPSPAYGPCTRAAVCYCDLFGNGEFKMPINYEKFDPHSRTGPYIGGH